MQSGIALAYNTFNGHKLTYGVGNYGYNTQYYWIDSSASAYESNINSAMSEWKYTTSYWGITTPIWHNRTTVKSSSRMDIYKVSNINQWWGLTQFYNGSTQVDPYNTNWVWGKILLDGDFSNYPKQKAVIAHEMGHVMELAHTSLTQAVMRPDIASTSNSITRA